MIDIRNRYVNWSHNIVIDTHLKSFSNIAFVQNGVTYLNGECRLYFRLLNCRKLKTPTFKLNLRRLRYEI